MQRIEITRAQFEEQFGIKPDPSSLGMMFCRSVDHSITGPIPQIEYVFTDESLPCECPLEVAELERIWRL